MILSENFKNSAQELSADQRKNLVTYIEYIYDKSKEMKNAVRLSDAVARVSLFEVRWPDTSISAFMRKPSSLMLPEASKQQKLLQVIEGMAKELKFGVTKESRFRGADLELYEAMAPIFKMGGRENTRSRSIKTMSVSTFEKAFHEHNPAFRIPTDHFRRFIRDQGTEAHNFTIAMRDALMEFTKLYLKGEIEISPPQGSGYHSRMQKLETEPK